MALNPIRSHETFSTGTREQTVPNKTNTGQSEHFSLILSYSLRCITVLMSMKMAALQLNATHRCSPSCVVDVCIKAI